MRDWKNIIRGIVVDVGIISSAVIIDYILLRLSLKAPDYLCQKNTSVEVCVGNVIGFIALGNLVAAGFAFKYRKWLVVSALVTVALALLALMSTA